MSYSGHVRSSDEICFPKSALLRIQPRAAGPSRYLIATTGRAQASQIPINRGLLVVDPRFDTLPVGKGWEYWV